MTSMAWWRSIHEWEQAGLMTPNEVRRLNQMFEEDELNRKSVALFHFYRNQTGAGTVAYTLPEPKHYGRAIILGAAIAALFSAIWVYLH